MKMLVGLGNEFRCDDSVGLRVAEALEKWASDDLIVQSYHGDALGLMALWEGVDELILVDAVRSLANSKDCLKIDLNAESLPKVECPVSSHGMGLLEAIEMSKALGTLPARALFFGIAATDFSQGRELSDPVNAAKSKLCQAIEKEWRLVNA